VSRLHYDLPAAGVTLAFEPTDFIQVNGPMNRLLIDHVMGLLGLQPGDRVLDLYCGLGNFTLPLARQVATVFGIEGDPGLVARAAGNASENGITNAHFAAADLSGPEATARCLALAKQGGATWSQVLLDPPRTGAADVLGAIAALAPRRVVYVSCHPGSLARDLGILVTAHGFRLREAGIVDMFPHTSHLESVAVLDGPGSPNP
jgi:23S rRNA (uracil1939-C5)-methyltransferase